MEKVQRKSAETAISGIFGRKKSFSKAGLSHVFGIANTHFCTKYQKKLMKKSRENAKKPIILAYFRHFWPEKMFFENRAQSPFIYYHFCISMQNFMKKCKVQLEKFKKYRFSGENRLFRRFSESSGFKNLFY